MRTPHVVKTASSCFAVLRQIRSVRWSVSRPTLQTLVASLVLTKLDYGCATLALTSGQPTRQAAVGTECCGATHFYGRRKYDHVTPLLRELHWLRVRSARTHYLPAGAGDTCVSLSAQHGAALSRRPVKSREQRRLSTAIALGINVRTYRSAHCTLDNRRPCVLCDRSSGVEHLDTVRAVL